MIGFMHRDYFVIDAIPSHTRLLALNLRADDAAELAALGASPARGVRRSYSRSVFRKTAFVDGHIAAMWGMGGPLLGDTGNPWLLTTPAVERAPFTMLREARAAVAEMLHVKPKLENRVDANYTRAIRFLEALGFEIEEAKPFGPKHHPFRRFYKEA